MTEFLLALYTPWLLPVFQLLWFCLICVQLWVTYRTRKIEKTYHEMAQRYVMMLAELERERAELLRASVHIQIQEHTNGRPVRPER